MYFANTGNPQHRGRTAEEVFAQGVDYFRGLEARFAELGVPLIREGIGLDFGCGVGRVLVPMAQHFRRAVGVDVSAQMLEEARRHLSGRGADLRLYDGVDIDGSLGELRYDFLHTARTVQHIPPPEGLRILESLLRRIEPGGAAYVQAPMAAPHTLFHRLNAIRERSGLLIRLGHAVAGRRTEFKPSDPVHHWYLYSADLLLPLFQRTGMEVRWVDLDPDLKGRQRATWYLHRP
jgi:trans-aconitate methyltransferase